MRSIHSFRALRSPRSASAMHLRVSDSACRSNSCCPGEFVLLRLPFGRPRPIVLPGSKGRPRGRFTTAYRRGRFLRTSGRPLHGTKMENAQDVGRAAEKVTQAIQRGELTPEQGATMMNILEMRSRVIEREDLEKRIRHLEQEAAAGGGKKP
jgi:hypothetical protein